MIIFNKPITSLTEVDLLDLITNQVSEGKLIDYKLTLPGNSDDERKEFLYDVSSFANTSGGYLIFGMDEEQGAASNLSGISNLDPDKEKLRIESILRDGIAPRIPGISIHVVEMKDGKSAVVIHVPQSWSSPHMVTLKNASRFYARHSAGKYQLDVQEIRQAFLLSENTAEKIRNYRLERLSQIGAGNTPILIEDGPKLVFHCVPLSAFQSGQTVDMQIAGQRYHTFFAEQRFSSRYNLDGILLFLDFQKGSPPPEYLQLSRSSQVEYVNGYIIGSNIWGNPRTTKFSISDVEKEVIDISKSALDYQKALNVEPPLIFSLSLLGVKGFSFGASPNLRIETAYHNHGIDRDNLLLPEILLDTFPESLDEMGKKLKPIFDALWNAAGWPRSMNYNEDGFWHSR